MHGLHLGLFYFSFLCAGLLMCFPGHSCPSNIIISVRRKHELRAGTCADAGMAFIVKRMFYNAYIIFYIYFWDGDPPPPPTPPGALRKLRTLCIGSGGTAHNSQSIYGFIWKSLMQTC